MEQQGELALKPTRKIEQPTRRETREAVERGDLKEALEEEVGADSPPNVVVEPEDKKTP
jgi:hypothetical protein